MDVGMLTCCALLPFMGYMKATELNKHQSLFQEIILWFWNAAEATKSIWCAKSEGAVNLSTVTTRWYKKFHLGCKNINDQAKLGRPKTIVSKACLVLLTRHALFSVVHHHHRGLYRSIYSCKIVLHITKILQNFWLSLVIFEAYNCFPFLPMTTLLFIPRLMPVFCLRIKCL